jgi:hypothetical protein
VDVANAAIQGKEDVKCFLLNESSGIPWVDEQSRCGYSSSMPSVHLLNQDGPPYPQPEEVSPDIWQSGFWYLSEVRSRALCGHLLHLHRKKSEPPFLSGRIVNYRRESYTRADADKATERTVFIFRTESGSGTATDAKGWSRTGIKYIP